MKKNIKYITGILFAGLALTACSPDEFSGADQNNLPTVDGVDFTVDVDQETNTITASVPEMKAAYPLWYMPAIRTSDNDSPKETDFYSTLSNVSKIYALCGEKTINLRVGNKNGFSQGVVTKKVVINNSLKDLVALKALLTGENGKMWRIASAEKAHLAYGNTTTDGTGTWAAEPDALADLCLYDDSVMFYGDGKYLYSPGEDGKVLRGGITASNEQAAQDQNSSWTMSVSGDNVILTLGKNTLFPFVANDGQFTNPKFRLENITKKMMTLVYDDGHTAWHFILTSDPFGAKAQVPGFGGFDADNDFNMFKGCTYTNTFYYAPGWAQLPNPDLTVNGNSFKLSYPEATSDTWQNQFSFETNIATAADKTYDFSVVINSTTDIPNATVKLCAVGGDETILLDKTKGVSLKADQPLVVYGTELAGLDISNVKIVFDFGGNPANTDVTISNIVLKDHANDDGIVAPYDYNDAGNLWKAVDANQAYKMSFWWADAGWAQVGDPKFEVSDKAYGGKVYTIEALTATAAEWQAQNSFETEVAIAAADIVDFSCVLTASKDSRATAKLCDTADDENSLFYDGSINLKADESKVVKFSGVQLKGGVDASKVKLIFDFGGCAEGTVFTITDVTILKRVLE